MSLRMRHLPGVAVLLLLTACASAPTQFYTLVPQTTAKSVVTPADYRVAVLPVTIPAQIDQPQMVVRQSDDRVALLEGEQWIGPLGDQIRAAVSDRLARDLDAVDVHGLPQADTGKVYRIKVDVRRFESVVGRYAQIDAAWSVRERGGHGETLSCSSSLKEPVADGYAALVHGHQQALAALSDRIAGAVRALAAGGVPDCPQ
ncbi:PqiC family protein [Oleiagrimonas sp. MCCC 1A03011]|uniref:PqiC family protein n=1 Tax=Oleiagrimonas sp. MCCC 1A03011 TaxID=1926883 RepID=UPI000DD77BFF|nr:PqiC family protein [Oleiagrimonas sp. MCCC 1A03011]